MMHPPPPPPMPHPGHYNATTHDMESNGRYGSKPDPPSLILVLNLVNVVTQLCLGSVAFSAFCMANLYDFTNSMSSHIYLCVIGYVILMSQSILSINPHVGWTRTLKHQDKKIIHGAMQILGSMLAIAGSIVRIVDINTHFASAHSVTGIIAMILTFFSLIGGLWNFIIPLQTSSFLYKTLHLCLGCLTLSVAFICLCLAFGDIFEFVFGPTNANLSIALAVFALVGVMTIAFSRTFMKIINGD